MEPTPTIVVKDSMDPARAMALAATLGRPTPSVLPRFWHHLHFWEARPSSELGRDGHPRQGLGVIPQTEFPRRMWAGGALEWHRDLVFGEPAERRSRLVAHDRKHGRTGPFDLVRLEHEVHQRGDLCVVERQDLVYRPNVGDKPEDSGKPAPPAPEGDVVGTVPTDPVTLFRFSALTLNSHRIHYDAAYARDVEGHRGIVVHGPLLAEALIHAAGAPHRFSYRATSPLFAAETGEVMRYEADFWIRGPDGRLCMEGRIG
ncbi:FAS1-like dehydratase domain-containing protein [Jannaschia aquimarina]|uniref:FAS1-like dehydratase domain-containing protein n=1 Tax=Jannaschia aquimarina TaxID=935700 RepID=A0A0D1EM11_9RHOB|nr:MaoC family dehydratase N-terminal domain-containing protein [Jannaschia aquimarina]KIT18011.1 hypothetical protein jaqu_02380 [Jannaschia aquimarina]SNS88508.1 3-methylfumaryl-CoA hydratase [Jannaschia aquimarina]